MSIPTPFPSRIATVRDRLKAVGADLLLVDYGELIAWVSGYITGETLYRACMVPTEGDPWLVLRALDAPVAQKKSWMADIRGFRDTEDPFLAVAGSIKERGFEKARIAVDSSSYSHTVHARSRLADALPQAAFIDLPGISNELRAVKDETEVGYLQRASKIADQSMERLRKEFGPGNTSRDAAAIAASSYLTFGADDGQVGRICCGTGGFGFLHAELDDTPLQLGDVLHVELVPRVNHYSARLMRPIVLGPPSDDLTHWAERLIARQDQQIAAMSAGAFAADVDAILREGVVKDGLRESYENVTGYNLGIYGRTPRSSDFSYIFLPNSQWTLKAGMVFHMYASARGIAFSETVLVTENGGKRLTRLPRKILIAASTEPTRGRRQRKTG
jgi:Xaa-Pro dipeptidase